MPRIAKNQNVQRNEIMNACVVLYNEKGLKFTMDDISKYCHISKKTMYLLFDDKEDLFLDMVDFVFDHVKESEKKVIEDNSLSTVEKIRKVLGVLPEGYTEIDFAELYLLKEKYPKIYEQLEERLETGWETTIALIEKGQEEGVIKKNIHVPLVKMMFESSLEKFFQRDVLKKNKISYKAALDEVVNIIVDGIVAK